MQFSNDASNCPQQLQQIVEAVFVTRLWFQALTIKTKALVAHSNALSAQLSKSFFRHVLTVVCELICWVKELLHLSCNWLPMGHKPPNIAAAACVVHV